MLKDYFSFTRNQSRAIIILMTGIIICLSLYFVMPYVYANEPEPTSDDLKKMMTQIKFNENSVSYANDHDKNYIPVKLTPFPFDPNTLDSAGFKRLGLRDKLIHTIINYRNKGGRFYKNESLKRIYGLHEEEYSQLEPYISIAENNDFNQRKKEVISVELNSADTGLLVKLRGIGSKLSMNIIQYRKQIGGFAKPEQLKEVYGISDETYDMIKSSVHVNPSLIKKINLNEATFNEISMHPYLRGEIARAIVDFRKKKNYHLDNIAQLKEIELINDEIFRKIAPYITIQ